MYYLLFFEGSVYYVLYGIFIYYVFYLYYALSYPARAPEPEMEGEIELLRAGLRS